MAAFFTFACAVKALLGGKRRRSVMSAWIASCLAVPAMLNLLVNGEIVGSLQQIGPGLATRMDRQGQKWTVAVSVASSPLKLNGTGPPVGRNRASNPDR